MNWVTIVWSIIAAACLTLAFVRFAVWVQKRTAWTDLAFSVLALATAGMAGAELWIMKSGSTGQIATAIRWGHVPTFVTIVSLLAFTRLYLRAGRRWLGWTVFILRMSALFLNFLVKPNINFREITGLRPVRFLGESVSVVEGVPNPLQLVTQLGTVLLVVFIADASVSAWRRGQRRAAISVGGSSLFFVLASMVNSVLVLWQIIAAPVMNSVFYIGLLAVMWNESTRGIVRAGQLADDLRESEARYRAIFEGSIEGIYRVSLEGKILFANPAAARILGYDSAEDFVRTVTNVGRQVWASPEDRSRGIQLIEKEGVLREYECLFKRKDGTPLWVSLNAAPVRDPDGRIVCFDGFLMDIDERKRAHDMLKRNERFLAETARIGKVGGWEFDIDTGKGVWTAETYNIHEVEPSFEPSMEKGLAYFTPASRPVIEQAVQQAIERDVPYDLELEIVTAKGHRRDVRTIGRADLQNRRVFGFIQDISQRKQGERETAQLRNERTHLARVLTVDEISTSLAHEINQPLGAILNNAEAAKILLSQAKDKRGDVREIIDDIIQDAKRAGDVVRKVRSIVKKSDAHFELLPVNALINEALAILRGSLVLKDAALDLELAPDLGQVRGDRVRLQQVILNLATNALDAMKEAPSKILTIRSAMDSPDMVIVSISDSGPGFPEARRELLFQPFFTTKKDGLGLGLPICRSIIEEHGGRIWAENNPGGGATFSFSLKVRREESV